MNWINPLQRFEHASRRFQPSPLRFLFIAEAPPAFRVNRLFYFTGLTNGDTLFLGMMKVLYPEQTGFTGNRFQAGRSVQEIRQQKETWLRRFQKDGYFLIDAQRQPMPDGASTQTKTSMMTASLPALRTRLRRLLGDRPVPIVLIGGVTYAVCADSLRQDGRHVLNASMIDHPARGGQVLFRQKLRAVLGMPD
ncbi:MAG TPA: hypothetical protein VGN16_08895 [Acidobacteriaceae bacterium]|jgi:hypothetical protein